MTQVISDKIQVSNQVWRRHTDPPGLWIAVFIASVILHLLAVWLIRFSGWNLSWQKNSVSVIPIDFVEVAPTKKIEKSVVRDRKSTAKKLPVSSAKPVTRNNSSGKVIQKNANVDGIVLTDDTKKKIVQKRRSQNVSKVARKKSVVQQNNIVKKQVAQSNKTQKTPVQPTPPNPNPRTNNRQPTPPNPNTRTNNRQPTPPNPNTRTNNRRPTPPNPNTRTNNRQPTPPNPNPRTNNRQPTPPNPNPRTNNRQPTPPNPNTEIKDGDGTKPWEQARGEIKLGTDKSKKLAPNPSLSPNQSSSSSGNNQGGELIVRINPLSRKDVLALATRKQGNFKLNTPPDVMAKYTGSKKNSLGVSILAKYPELKAANLIASLVIDKNGKFEQALVLDIKPQKLAGDKVQYQKFLNEHFRNQKFTPAFNNNGTKPEVSNLILTIAIETNLPGSMVENK